MSKENPPLVSCCQTVEEKCHKFSEVEQEPDRREHATILNRTTDLIIVVILAILAMNKCSMNSFFSLTYVLYNKKLHVLNF